MSTQAVPVRGARRSSASLEKPVPYPQSMPVSMQPMKKKARRPSENAAVLCQHCGKNYKHQQCLAKHLWEHSPYWSSIPNSQPLSKHQKVQLLETASILCKLSGSPNLHASYGTPSEMRDVIMEGDVEDDEDDSQSPNGGSSIAVDDDEDAGVFGRMES